MTRFAIVSNGFAYGPAEALRDYLVGRGAEVVTVEHPLTSDRGTAHTIAHYVEGRRVRTRAIRLPLRPPLSFAADPFVPPRLPSVDVWFGFNPLACARGLAERRLGRAGKVVLWSVDFVPDRFGEGTLLTRLYDWVDRHCCRHADARVELSPAAREARDQRHGLGGAAARTLVVPMGAWLDRVPVTPEDGFRAKRIVYLGHLVPRQGVDVLLEAVALIRREDEAVTADVIGTGPQYAQLRRRASELGIAEAVRFHGFVADYRKVEHVLAGASVAAAPYATTDDSFTRHADPGKLKAYLAAGLPVVVTDVPPNARALERTAGAEIVAYEAEPLAGALQRALYTPDEWIRRRNAALEYARRFDWQTLLGDLLSELDIRLQAGR